MQKNLINLAVIVAVMMFIFGCVCPSADERENDSSSSAATEETPKKTDETKAAANKTADKKDASEGGKPDEGDFVVRHSAVTNARYQEIDKQIRDDKVLEDAAAQFNRALKLPFDIMMESKDCNEINAFYDPRSKTITVCYELMEYYYKLFKAAGANDEKAYDKMNDAVRFAFLHEVGHALIDAYKLPVMGNEEDAADRCSAYISLEEAEGGEKYILAAADAFAIESKMSKGVEKNMADEHLLQEQRFFNSLCMMYGSNPTKYEGFVTEGYLPKERAARCPSEYQRTMQSWKDLLKPWRKN